MAAYAKKAAGEVRQLLDAGVPPDHVTVVGFSKGGAIAIRTSSLVKVAGVRYVFLAACFARRPGDPVFPVTGHVLAIHEASDTIGLSCASLFGGSPQAAETREIGSHGPAPRRVLSGSGPSGSSRRSRGSRRRSQEATDEAARDGVRGHLRAPVGSACSWGPRGLWWSGARRPRPTLIGRVYLGYNISPLGAAIGLLWGLVDGFVGGAVFALLYNTLQAVFGRPAQ